MIRAVVPLNSAVGARRIRPLFTADGGGLIPHCGQEPVVNTGAPPAHLKSRLLPNLGNVAGEPSLVTGSRARASPPSSSLRRLSPQPSTQVGHSSIGQGCCSQQLLAAVTLDQQCAQDGAGDVPVITDGLMLTRSLRYRRAPTWNPAPAPPPLSSSPVTGVRA